MTVLANALNLGTTNSHGRHDPPRLCPACGAAWFLSEVSVGTKSKVVDLMCCNSHSHRFPVRASDPATFARHVAPWRCRSADSGLEFGADLIMP